MKQITPMKTIRLKCLDCTGNQPLQIKACPCLECPLWKFRLGLHPYTERNKRNPFLEPNNFIGLQNRQAEEVIKSLDTLKN